MPARRILILGGTGDARRLAARLLDDGHHVVSSLAGVTANPALPPGEVRSGGFGGADGLAAYIRQCRFDAIADVTHPFAAVISRNACQAAKMTTIPCIRLEQPPWRAEVGERWCMVGDAKAAADALEPGARALVTIGRKALRPFFARAGVRGLARMIEPPDCDVPDGWRVLLARPPFTLENERALFVEQRISVLVTKNAGGTVMAAKLMAARETATPVIMIERPKKPDVPVAASVEQAALMILRSDPPNGL